VRVSPATLLFSTSQQQGNSMATTSEHELAELQRELAELPSRLNVWRGGRGRLVIGWGKSKPKLVKSSARHLIGGEPFFCTSLRHPLRWHSGLANCRRGHRQTRIHVRFKR
jgi:hypothetical protein